MSRRQDTHLGLASLAVMSRDANLVKQAVQLSNAAIDLLGQVAGVHCGQKVVRLHGGQRRRRA